MKLPKLNKYQFQINTNFKSRIGNYKFDIRNWKFEEGFSLVEVLLAVFLIIALTTILFATSGTLFTTRRSRLQSQAAKIASKEIEYLRNIPFASLPGNATNTACVYGGDSVDVTADLQKLKSASCNRQTTNYDGKADPPTTPSTEIKLITITITWRGDKGESQTLNMDTLIYKNGL